MIKDLIKEKKIGIFSVGTAGHVLPSVRIVKELEDKGFNLDNVIVVTGNRDEKRFYKDYKIDILEYDFVRTEKSIIHYIKNISKVVKSLLYLNKVINKNKISVIFTTGSYISPLVCVLGFVKRIPSFIQEQNIYGGLGNYVGSYFAKVVYTSFPNTKNILKSKINYVGPVLPTIDKFTKKNRPSFILGVQGGSQGSIEVNNLVYETFKDWDGFNIELHHITGSLDVIDINNARVNYIKYKYIKNISKYYESIEAQITRGGGGILEGASIGCVQIILPYKHGTTPTHQKNNALYLEKKKAAFLIDNSSDTLKEIITKLGRDKSEGYSSSYREYSNNAVRAVKQGGRELITDELIYEHKRNI